MGPIARLLGNGIGLANEALAANKTKKERSPSPNPQGSQHQGSQSTGQVHASSASTTSGSGAPPPYAEHNIADPVHAGQSQSGGQVPSEKHAHDNDSSDEDLSDDEEQWALDDAATKVTEGDKDPKKPERGLDALPTIESLARIVVAACNPPPTAAHPLPQPVILPQRRPGDKARGFVRAYAPVLESKGIPEEAFISFVDTMDTASKASPLLNVVSVSASVVGMIPEPTAQITFTVVKIAVGRAQELQQTQRGNSFLDEINEHLFKPRGLYALVMTYKPEATRPIDAQPTDVTSVVSQRMGTESSSFAGAHQTDSGTTYGELQMPEAAPLRYPALDKAIASADAETTNKLKSSQNFIADYYDRRAQAVYAAQNPNSSLSVPSDQSPQFASRYSDPNNPVNNGSLIALLTGGNVNPGTRRQERREGRRARRGRPARATGGTGGQPQSVLPRQRIKQRRAMKKGVLYLMIVNLPSKQELVAARKMFDGGNGWAM